MAVATKGGGMAAAAAAQPAGRPVAFIVPAKDELTGKSSALFTISPEALGIMEGIKVPVAPIGVVGRYRTGKSFLMNKLVAQQAKKGFEVGPTVEACTKGIWLWSEPFYTTTNDGTSVAVLFFDTEGIGSTGASTEHDARVFSLATLLSSLIIYNSIGAVDEEAVQGLSFIANLTRHIQMRSGGAQLEKKLTKAELLDKAADHDEMSSSTVKAKKPSSGKSTPALSGAGGAATAAGSKAGGRPPPPPQRAGDSDDEEDREGGGGDEEEEAEEEEELDRDSDDDEDDEDDTDHYIAKLKREQQKKRAAAKRELARRLKMEAQRMGGAAAGGQKGGSTAAAGSAASSSAGGGASAGVKGAVSFLAAGSGGTAGLSGAGGAGAGEGADGAGEDAALSAFFPSFLWVLRDFSLNLLDDEGQDISADEYLESCLRQQNSYSSEAQARNRTRRILTSFFKERACATLVRPLDEEEKLQAMDTLPESALRQEFRTQLAALRARIFQQLLRPKTLRGQLVTGRMLGGLAQACVQAINAQAVPSISTAWQAVARQECQAAEAGAWSFFQEQLDREAPLQGMPYDVELLERLHAKARIEAMGHYEGKAVRSEAGVDDKYKEELKSKMGRLIKDRTLANAAASEQACTRLITRLWQQHIQPKLLQTEKLVASAADSREEQGYLDHKLLNTDFTTVREAYVAEARGPAAHRVLSNFLLEALPPLVRVVNSAATAEAQRSGEEARQQLASRQTELELLQTRFDSLQSQLGLVQEERQQMLLRTAKAEQTASSFTAEKQHLEGEVQELKEEREELAQKLREERVAHAAVRVQLRAAGISEAATAAVAAAAVRTANAAGSPKDSTGKQKGAANPSDSTAVTIKHLQTFSSADPSDLQLILREGDAAAKAACDSGSGSKPAAGAGKRGSLASVAVAAAGGAPGLGLPTEESLRVRPKLNSKAADMAAPALGQFQFPQVQQKTCCTVQ